MAPTPPDLSRLRDARGGSGHRSESDALRRAARRGDLIGLRRGIYRQPLPDIEELPKNEQWRERRRRYLEEVAAVGLTRSGPVIFAGETALAIHGYPTLGAASAAIELLEPLGSTRRRAEGLVVRLDSFRSEDVVPWGEFFVTAPARTLADAARLLPRAKAVTALDFALSGARAEAGLRVTKDEMRDALEASAAVLRRARAEAAIDFADDRAGSAGESVSRCLIDDFGFPAPLLQVRHAAPRHLGGGWYFTDFEWPEHGLIGEFDGLVKFQDPGILAGRDPSQAVIAEKLREDALRRGARSVARWTWPYLRRPILLRELLVEHGLPAARAVRHLARPW